MSMRHSWATCAQTRTCWQRTPLRERGDRAGGQGARGGCRRKRYLTCGMPCDLGVIERRGRTTRVCWTLSAPLVGDPSATDTFYCSRFGYPLFDGVCIWLSRRCGWCERLPDGLVKVTGVTG